MHNWVMMKFERITSVSIFIAIMIHSAAVRSVYD